MTRSAVRFILESTAIDALLVMGSSFNRFEKSDPNRNPVGMI
jgi:hypothetical protein